MANANPLTLTRQQLYDLVWSKSVRDVAADFGMSDVALAKHCRAVRAPIPPRGYWAKVAAGQTPRKTPLPKHRSSRFSDAGGDSTTADEPTVTFTPRPAPPAPEPTAPPPQKKPCCALASMYSRSHLSPT